MYLKYHIINIGGKPHAEIVGLPETQVQITPTCDYEHLLMTSYMLWRAYCFSRDLPVFATGKPPLAGEGDLGVYVDDDELAKTAKRMSDGLKVMGITMIVRP